MIDNDFYIREVNVYRDPELSLSIDKETGEETLKLAARENQIDGTLLYVDQVYHEPPNTFLQGTAEEGRYYTVSALLERLEKIDASVPFDANIVFGDDWNYQEIKDVSERGGILIIRLSEPILGSNE